MTTEPSSPADIPTQAQLDLLAVKLEESYNSYKERSCALLLSDWDEKYAPLTAFRGLGSLGLDSLTGGQALLMLALLPVTLTFILLWWAYCVPAACWNYRNRLKQLRHSPPRPNEADLAHNIRFPLSTENIRSYRDVARVVCKNLATYATHFKYVNSDGVSVGSDFGGGGKLSYVEFSVLRFCLIHCRSLVDKATLEAYRTHYRKAYDERRQRREYGHEFINEDDCGEDDYVQTVKCVRCGETHFVAEDGWMLCSLCYQSNGRRPRGLSMK
jgi:hypothetical protein